MATPKIILYKHKTYTDKTHPIILQVVKNGKPIRKVISRCLEKDWNFVKSRVSVRHNEAPRINNEIEKALRNYGLSTHTLKGFWEEHIENYKLKQQVSRYESHKSFLVQLIEFSPNVNFEDVTETFIYKFCSHLSKKYGNNENTIKAKMDIFSSFMKLAKRNRAIIENPFDYVKFAKVKVQKVKLTIDEMKAISSIELKRNLDEARDIFMGCIYLRGIRMGDLITMRTKNIVDGRLNYIESKTGRHYSVFIPEELKEIFNKWIGKNKFGYIFTYMAIKEGTDKFAYKAEIKKAITKINREIKQVAKLSGIEKSISTHTARHSFSRLANITIKDTSITKDLIGHSTLAVHEGYISEISDDIEMDGYAKQVLDKLKD